jgi:hypothetical protein
MPLEVHRSLRKRGNVSRPFSLNLWLRYNTSILRSLTPENSLVTHYESYWTNPRAELKRVLAWVGLAVTADVIDSACQTISSQLRHHRVSLRFFLGVKPPPDVVQTYRDLCRLAGPVFLNSRGEGAKAFLGNPAASADPRQRSTIVCTIVPKNQMHHARTLMASVARVHPEWQRYVLLADTLDGEFDPKQECFQMVRVSEIGIPDLAKLAYRYRIHQFNTAVKPWFLFWLFQHRDAQNIVYFDPDIQVYSRLTDVELRLKAGALAVLTPHLTGHLDDDHQPNEHDFLKGGCYNLGFVAVGRHIQTLRFLRWWQAKLERNCVEDSPRNHFLDQRWMDLAPGLFDDVHINSQDRIKLADFPIVRELVESYIKTLTENGRQKCVEWPHGFGRLANGTLICHVARAVYRENPEIEERAGPDPFAHGHDYLNEPCLGNEAPIVTRLMLALWTSTPELQRTFPDIGGSSRIAYAQAFVQRIALVERIPEAYVKPVRDSLYSIVAAAAQKIADRTATGGGRA